MPDQDTNVPMKKMIIRKSVTRKYNVQKYESVDIVVDIEHEVEYPANNPKILHEKSMGLAKYLMKDFTDTKELVFKELSVSEKKAFGNADAVLGAVDKNDLDVLG